MNSRNYCLLLSLFLVSISLAQDRAQFTRGQEFYLKGNTTVVGNSILGKSASKSFDKMDKVNDAFKMRYIDIDNDPSTWSSSSAYFSVPEESQIVYAGLYWSATYHGERSGERINDNVIFYKKLEERAHNPQSIKLKVPNGAYQDITGTLIYDGENAKNRTVKSRAPYAYAADVTQLLQDYYEGDITVANVSATQGKINGGSSAGWLLYIVYEDDAEPYQYITTYYGLESVKKEVVEIDFGNFKSSEDGEFSTYVTIAAIEGDTNLDKDQVRMYNPKSEIYLPFGNRVRPPNNFFNSSITVDEEVVLERNPASKNTLGFDLAKVKIDNELNSIIANSPEGVKMQFKTRGDHYFIFFTAFQTTISEKFYKEKPIAQGEAVVKEVISDVTIEDPIVEKIREEAVVTKDTIIPSKPSAITAPIFSEILVEIVDKTSVDVPGMRSGFYIISNVFSSQENAKKWEQTLLSKDLTSYTFLRPDNNLYYVSLGSNTDPLIMYEVLKRMREDKDLEKSWILKINM